MPQTYPNNRILGLLGKIETICQHEHEPLDCGTLEWLFCRLQIPLRDLWDAQFATTVVNRIVRADKYNSDAAAECIKEILRNTQELPADVVVRAVKKYSAQILRFFRKNADYCAHWLQHIDFFDLVVTARPDNLKGILNFLGRNAIVCKALIDDERMQKFSANDLFGRRPVVKITSDDLNWAFWNDNPYIVILAVRLGMGTCANGLDSPLNLSGRDYKAAKKAENVILYYTLDCMNNEGSNFAHLKDFLCEAAGNRYAKDDPAFCVEMLEYIAKLETRVTAFSSAQASTSLRPISV